MIFHIDPFICQVEQIANYFDSDYGKHFDLGELRTLADALDTTALSIKVEILRRVERGIYPDVPGHVSQLRDAGCLVDEEA